MKHALLRTLAGRAIVVGLAIKVIAFAVGAATGAVPTFLGVADAVAGLAIAAGGAYFAFKLKGQTQAQVLGRFGPPAERESYRAVERGGEFYGAIEHEYPSSIPANRDVPIEEWTWTSGECILTVWFHRPQGTPIVLYDIYWHQDTAF